MGHTPGPWAVYPPEMLDNQHWSVQTDCGMTIVCGEDTPEAAANARLIAAAPELLASLRECSTALADLLADADPSGLECQEQWACVAECKKVIAKAEGRSE